VKGISPLIRRKGKGEVKGVRAGEILRKKRGLSGATRDIGQGRKGVAISKPV